GEGSGERLREVADPGLRRLVHGRREAVAAGVDPDGGDVDDPAPLPLDHPGDDAPAQPEDGAEVGVDDAREDVLVEGEEIDAVENGGAVDQDVDLSPGRFRLGDDTCAAGGIREV